MKICLAQSFPLGRFHATPWKVFPYDDPHGEWPPSPWRLLRALLAKSHQLERETGSVSDETRTELVRAFAASEIGWHLPDFSWRGPGLRQYHPAEFKKMPAAAKEPGLMTYNTTKVQDNFWLTGGDDQPLIWILESDRWTDSTLTLLDACLSRLTYFGRAESITKISRIQSSLLNINCRLQPDRFNINRDPANKLVPVLCPLADATLEQLQMTTDDKLLRNSTVPPGATWKFATRPERAVSKPQAARPSKAMNPVKIMQFALGSKVAPNRNHFALLTNRFRGRVIRMFLGERWENASPDAKDAVALLAGKNAQGSKLDGHQHAFFAIWIDPATQKPARLMTWRSTPFEEREQRAILAAADAPLSLGYNNSSKKEPGRDPWTVQLVPLDSTVPPPPGFGSGFYQDWVSTTPYVPSRHVVDRRGKAKRGESVEEQLQQEIALRGLPTPDLNAISVHAESQWIKIHGISGSGDRNTNLSKRGYHVRASFPEPIPGPLALGHSCHFGLGLFVPVPEPD